MYHQLGGDGSSDTFGSIQTVTNITGAISVQCGYVSKIYLTIPLCIVWSSEYFAHINMILSKYQSSALFSDR
jgi:hypothetical protein